MPQMFRPWDGTFLQGRLLSIGDKKQEIAHDSKRVPHTLGLWNDHNETMRDTHFQIYIIGAFSLRQVWLRSALWKWCLSLFGLRGELLPVTVDWFSHGKSWELIPKVAKMAWSSYILWIERGSKQGNAAAV